MPDTKVAALLADLQKRYGPDKVMMASDIPIGPPISTGSLALDFATGYGGLPNNRVVEICGKEGTGKTTLSLMTLVNALKDSPQRGALFLDLEHKVTPEWLEQIVGTEVMEHRIIYLQPTSIEEATNMYRRAVGSGQVAVAILDSIGGAPTVRRNEDAEVGHYGGNAIGVGEFARSAATMASAHNCLTIGINQTRVDMTGRFILNTPGGSAWKHAVIMRIELVKGKDTHTIRMPGEEKPVPVGNTIYAKVRKNQVGPPGRTAYWWFFNVPAEEHTFGIDTLDEIIRLSIATRVVTLRGGWYHHPALPVDPKDEHKVHGLPKLQNAIRADEKLRDIIVAEVRANLKDHAAEVAPMSDPDAPVEEPTGMAKMYVEGVAPE